MPPSSVWFFPSYLPFSSSSASYLFFISFFHYRILPPSSFYSFTFAFFPFSLHPLHLPQLANQALKLANGENNPPVGYNLGTPWSEEEKAALIEGVAEMGKEWAKILEKYQSVFSVNARTNRNLMDKWRNMETVRMNRVRRYVSGNYI